MLSSYNSYNQIDYFQVGKFIPWISDHCPLHYSLTTKTKVNLTNRTLKLDKTPKQYFWDTNCKEKLIKEFNSETLKTYFDRILHRIVDPEEIAKQFIDVFHLATKNAKIKLKRTKETFNEHPWFDLECKTLTNNMRKIANDIKRDPRNENLRIQLFSKKKEFKYLVRRKKRAYQNNIFNNINISKKESKTFWKELNKLNGSNKNEFF